MIRCPSLPRICWLTRLCLVALMALPCATPGIAQEPQADLGTDADLAAQLPQETGAEIYLYLSHFPQAGMDVPAASQTVELRQTTGLYLARDQDEGAERAATGDDWQMVRRAVAAVIGQSLDALDRPQPQPSVVVEWMVAGDAVFSRGSLIFAPEDLPPDLRALQDGLFGGGF